MTTHLKGIPFRQAKWMGGTITPRLVVLHDTASRLGIGQAADYLADNGAEVSVHFVIEQDGSIEQQVPLDRAAWHAGRSHYHGADHCNDFSIGIELVGPGKMEDAGDYVRAWWGQLFPKRNPEGEPQVFFRETPEHGAGWWMPPSDAQIVAVTLLLERLFEEVPTLKDVRGHWYVSPGRKVDPSPLFPMETIRTLVLGRDAADFEAETSADELWEPEGDEMVEIDVRSGALNMRRWPSFNPNVIAQIPDGVVVPVIRKGVFDNRHWLRVLYDGQEGWIVARYTAAITEKDAA
ncbi:MAG: N-acetylmuramoyl-L-alanine amidase [Pseudomonadota bacterium]